MPQPALKVCLPIDDRDDALVDQGEQTLAKVGPVSLMSAIALTSLSFIGRYPFCEMV
jgi:hypothetical protein